MLDMHSKLLFLQLWGLFYSVMDTVSVTVMRTFVSYVGANTLSLGIAGVWLGMLGDQVSRFIMSGLRFKQGKWVNIKI